MKSHHIVVSLLTLMSAIPGRCLNADDQEVTEAVRSAWEQRWGAAETLEVHFDSQSVVPLPAGETGPSINADGREYRPHAVRHSVWISGRDVAIEVMRDPDSVPWLPARDHYVHTSAGSQRIHTDRERTGFDSASDGAVDGNAGNAYYGLYAIYFPLFLTYHGSVESNYEFPLDSAVVVEGDHEAGGVRCIVLRSEREAGRTLYATELWLDPERAFIPLRIIRRRNERPSVTYECEYQPHAAVGHQLTAWKMTAVNQAGKLSVSDDVSVEEFRVNSDVSSDQFEIAFPPGARVLVESTGDHVTVAADGSIPGWTAPGPVSGKQVFLIVVGVMAVVLLVIGVRYALSSRRATLR